MMKIYKQATNLDKIDLLYQFLYFISVDDFFSSLF